MQPEAPAAAAHRPLGYDGRAGELLPIALLNAVLTVVTLLTYRFWARARVRRYLWGHTVLYGDALEYTGTGRELFVGFLKAMGFVFLPYVVYTSLVQGLLLPDRPVIATLLVLPAYLAIPYLFGQAIWRARRYRLSRTLWRGIRPGLAGSPHDFALAFVGHGVLAAVTLGWAWPRMQWRLQQRLWGDTQVGDRTFRLDGDAGPLMGPFAVLWCAGFLAVLCLAGAAMAAAQAQLQQAGGDAAMAASLLTLAGILAAIGALQALAAGLLYSWYRARFLGHLADGLRFEGLRFHFDATAGALLRLVLGNGLIVVLTLGTGLPLVQQRVFRFACSRLLAAGEADLEAIRQNALAVPGSGEGLADAFDIGSV